MGRLQFLALYMVLLVNLRQDPVSPARVIVEDGNDIVAGQDDEDQAVKLKGKSYDIKVFVSDLERTLPPPFLETDSFNKHLKLPPDVFDRIQGFLSNASDTMRTSLSKSIGTVNVWAPQNSAFKSSKDDYEEITGIERFDVRISFDEGPYPYVAGPGGCFQYGGYIHLPFTLFIDTKWDWMFKPNNTPQAGADFVNGIEVFGDPGNIFTALWMSYRFGMPPDHGGFASPWEPQVIIGQENVDQDGKMRGWNILRYNSCTNSTLFKAKRKPDKPKSDEDDPFLDRISEDVCYKRGTKKMLNYDMNVLRPDCRIKEYSHVLSAHEEPSMNLQDHYFFANAITSTLKMCNEKTHHHYRPTPFSRLCPMYGQEEVFKKHPDNEKKGGFSEFGFNVHRYTDKNLRIFPRRLFFSSYKIPKNKRRTKLYPEVVGILSFRLVFNYDSMFLYFCAYIRAILGRAKVFLFDDGVVPDSYPYDGYYSGFTPALKRNMVYKLRGLHCQARVAEPIIATMSVGRPGLFPTMEHPLQWESANCRNPTYEDVKKNTRWWQGGNFPKYKEKCVLVGKVMDGINEANTACRSRESELVTAHSLQEQKRVMNVYTNLKKTMNTGLLEVDDHGQKYFQYQFKLWIGLFRECCDMWTDEAKKQTKYTLRPDFNWGRHCHSCNCSCPHRSSACRETKTKWNWHDRKKSDVDMSLLCPNEPSNSCTKDEQKVNQYFGRLFPGVPHKSIQNEPAMMISGGWREKNPAGCFADDGGTQMGKHFSGVQDHRGVPIPKNKDFGPRAFCSHKSCPMALFPSPLTYAVGKDGFVGTCCPYSIRLKKIGEWDHTKGGLYDVPMTCQFARGEVSEKLPNRVYKIKTHMRKINVALPVSHAPPPVINLQKTSLRNGTSSIVFTVSGTMIQRGSSNYGKYSVVLCCERNYEALNVLKEGTPNYPNCQCGRWKQKPLRKDLFIRAEFFKNGKCVAVVCAAFGTLDGKSLGPPSNLISAYIPGYCDLILPLGVAQDSFKRGHMTQGQLMRFYCRHGKVYGKKCEKEQVVECIDGGTVVPKLQNCAKLKVKEDCESDCQCQHGLIKNKEAVFCHKKKKKCTMSPGYMPCKNQDPYCFTKKGCLDLPINFYDDVPPREIKPKVDKDGIYIDGTIVTYTCKAKLEKKKTTCTDVDGVSSTWKPLASCGLPVGDPCTKDVDCGFPKKCEKGKCVCLDDYEEENKKCISRYCLPLNIKNGRLMINGVRVQGNIKLYEPSLFLQCKMQHFAIIQGDVGVSFQIRCYMHQGIPHATLSPTDDCQRLKLGDRVPYYRDGDDPCSISIGGAKTTDMICVCIKQPEYTVFESADKTYCDANVACQAPKPSIKGTTIIGEKASGLGQWMKVKCSKRGEIISNHERNSVTLKCYKIAWKGLESQVYEDPNFPSSCVANINGGPCEDDFSCPAGIICTDGYCHCAVGQFLKGGICVKGADCPDDPKLNSGRLNPGNKPATILPTGAVRNALSVRHQFKCPGIMHIREHGVKIIDITCTTRNMDPLVSYWSRSPAEIFWFGPVLNCVEDFKKLHDPCFNGTLNTLDIPPAILGKACSLTLPNTECIEDPKNPGQMTCQCVKEETYEKNGECISIKCPIVPRPDNFTVLYWAKIIHERAVGVRANFQCLNGKKFEGWRVSSLNFTCIRNGNTTEEGVWDGIGDTKFPRCIISIDCDKEHPECLADNSHCNFTKNLCECDKGYEQHVDRESGDFICVKSACYITKGTCPTRSDFQDMYVENDYVTCECKDGAASNKTGRVSQTMVCKMKLRADPPYLYWMDEHTQEEVTKFDCDKKLEEFPQDPFPSDITPLTTLCKRYFSGFIMGRTIPREMNDHEFSILVSAIISTLLLLVTVAEIAFFLHWRRRARRTLYCHGG